jgi:hypothetical protein
LLKVLKDSVKAKLLPEQILQSRDFANRSNSSKFREECRGDRSNTKDMDYLGKLGEYGFFNIAKGLDLDPTEPDLRILDPEHKSFDADMILKGKIKVHIKTRITPWRFYFARAWLVSSTDKMFKSNDKDGEYLALMHLTEDGSECKLHGFLTIGEAKAKNLFCIPEKREFVKFKKALEQRHFDFLWGDRKIESFVSIIEKEAT